MNTKIKFQEYKNARRGLRTTCQHMQCIFKSKETRDNRYTSRWRKISIRDNEKNKNLKNKSVPASESDERQGNRNKSKRRSEHLLLNFKQENYSGIRSYAGCTEGTYQKKSLTVKRGVEKTIFTSWPTTTLI